MGPHQKMAADQWPLSLWLVASFFLQLAFPRTLHPLPQPPATQKTIDPIAIPGWSTVVTSVDVAGLVILCEVSFSFRVDHEGFAEWREFKARPCIVWPPGGVAPERAFQHKFKFSYSDTKSLDCSASASVVGVGLGLIPVYFKVDEGKFKETLSCSIEEDQESVAEVQKSEVEVFTIPIGQGDSTVIKCPGPEGDISIIDMGCLDPGNGCRGMSVEKYVTLIERQFLGRDDSRAADYSRLKRVFLTHPDADHMNYGWVEGRGPNNKPTGQGTGAGLLEKWSQNRGNNKIDVHLGNKAPWEKDKPGFVDFLKIDKGFVASWRGDWNDQDQIPVQLCNQPDQPDATIKMIASDLGKNKNKKNDKSMVMSLRVKARNKMLFLGDLETEPAYNNLLYPTHAPPSTSMHPHPTKYVDEIRNHQIVMVPHHGSNTNGNPNAIFYNEVNPICAIVSSAMLSSNSKTKSPKVETLQAICRGHTATVDFDFYPLGGPIGWATYTCECPNSRPLPVPFQGNLTADWDWLDDSDPDDPDEYPYCPDSDCSNSDNTDLDIKARPVTPKYQYEYMPQELNHCDVHIYQTSKLIAYYENRPNKHRLFMIVTKISATNTIVTASQYGEDV